MWYSEVHPPNDRLSLEFEEAHAAVLGLLAQVIVVHAHFRQQLVVLRLLLAHALCDKEAVAELVVTSLSLYLFDAMKKLYL